MLNIKSFKINLKKTLREFLFGCNLPIVVASTGRAGSTLLVNAISEAYINNYFKEYPAFFKNQMANLTTSYANQLLESDISMSGAPILKTHDLDRLDKQIELKKVFIFTDPLDSALSVMEQIKQKGSSWGKRHLFHLQSSGNLSDLFQVDILNYEIILDSWKKSNAFIVHYDDLWSRVDCLSDYLQFDVVLPSRKPRKVIKKPNNINTILFDDLQKICDECRDFSLKKEF